MKNSNPLRDITRAQLLAVPLRDWKAVETYSQLYFVPLRKRHASGWGMFGIIGRRDDGSMERITGQDDVSFVIHGKNPVRVDLTYPGGIFHYWGKVTFSVGVSLSSVEIVVRDQS